MWKLFLLLFFLGMFFLYFLGKYILSGYCLLIIYIRRLGGENVLKKCICMS